MKPAVYIETTIVSYLTARPSRDIVTAAHQQLTHEWWEKKRQDFDCYVSELVIKEASAGDPNESKRRLIRLRDLIRIEAAPEARELARLFLTRKVLPAKAVTDATHIAIAAAGGLDFLLTWNCSHIANAQLEARLAVICLEAGYQLPIICTPEELMGE